MKQKQSGVFVEIGVFVELGVKMKFFLCMLVNLHIGLLFILCMAETLINLKNHQSHTTNSNGTLSTILQIFQTNKMIRSDNFF